MINNDNEVVVQPKTNVNAVKTKYMLKRNKEGVNLKNGINVKQHDLHDDNMGGSDKAHRSEVEHEDSLSSNESEFVDATQKNMMKTLEKKCLKAAISLLKLC